MILIIVERGFPPSIYILFLLVRERDRKKFSPAEKCKKKKKDPSYKNICKKKSIILYCIVFAARTEP